MEKPRIKSRPKTQQHHICKIALMADLVLLHLTLAAAVARAVDLFSAKREAESVNII